MTRQGARDLAYRVMMLGPWRGHVQAWPEDGGPRVGWRVAVKADHCAGRYYVQTTEEWESIWRDIAHHGPKRRQLDGEPTV